MNIIVQLSSKRFLAGCLAGGLVIAGIGRWHPWPSWVVAAEVFATIIALFIFGSIRYRLDKNALTYGAVLVITGTFWQSWWQSSHLKAAIVQEGAKALWEFVRHHFLTLHGLDQLIHADTMLFILGLTFFVGAIAQTRLLESVSFTILEKTKGAVLPTVGFLGALVAFSSGILDGVSMIGLMIRTMVIILLLAKIKNHAVVYAVMISTLVTTVCGMWLAYGEPPNLIMKANLHPHLDNAFFLRYCLSIAVGTYLIILWNMRQHLGGKRIMLQKLDVLDLHTADVRFLQAERHGEVLTPIEFVEEHAEDLGTKLEGVLKHLHNGMPLGEALVREGVPKKTRLKLLGKFVAEDAAEALDEHYEEAGQGKPWEKTAGKIKKILLEAASHRTWSQKIGGLSFVPFIGLLIWHAVDHDVPLFWSSFAGFFAAIFGIWKIPKTRRLALKESRHEFAEYLFLIPLFFSITLLQKTGFFEHLSRLLHAGITSLGVSHVAYGQFLGATFLSAILDNNVVADFAGRAIQGMEVATLHLFAMAQIAGYAVGGCWTHIGSAQSVVAYAFIQKEVDEHYTPFQWIKVMTPLILEIMAFVTVVVYLEGFFFKG